MRYRTCTALDWFRGISAAQPATSCQQIAKTKAYTDIESVWIDTDGKGGAAPWKTTCDLTSAGGGWTQITAQTSATQVNTLLGGKGEVMFKCSLGGEAFLRSPVTSATWSDTTTLFTGGPMTICTKPSGGFVANSQHKGWRVFVRKAP